MVLLLEVTEPTCEPKFVSVVVIRNQTCEEL
jgi:hypothetical protein